MAKVKCNHCHLEFDDGVMIKEESLNFCCSGCQSVYHILKDDGLTSFYDKLGNKTITPPIKFDDDTNRFDSESFYKRFVKQTPEGFNKIDLIIEGIHCAACVWLNEKVLYDLDGIIEANINFTTNKAKIIWDEKQTTLSHIIDRIRSIGYNAYAYDAAIADEKAIKAKRDYFIKMMVAVFASLNIMMLAVAKYTGFFTGITDEVKNLIHIGEFILTTPVLFYSGQIFYKGAYYGLKNKIVNMDLLVSSGSTLTYIYSLYILFGGVGETYFDSVTMIITFVLVGKYLEVIGKKSAIDTLDKIKSSIPLEATVIRDNKKEIVSLDEILIGDIVEVKAGSKVVVDGIINSGESNFDESSITGESVPIYKKCNDKVYSGTLNLDGVVTLKATKDFANSTLSSIVNLLEDALSSKPKIEQKANEISKYFSSTILSIAFLTFLGWYFFGGELYFVTNATQFEKAFIVAISVIVIACPCALALATPIASLVGINELAKNSLLFKEARYIESMAKANVLVVDKTGTITKGSLSVVDAKLDNISLEELNLLYSIIESSNHLVSLAIKKYLLSNYHNLELLNLQNIKSIQAKGVKASFGTKTLVGGNSSLLNDEGIEITNSYENTSYVFAIDKKVVATFELEDELKDYAKDFISYIKQQNIEVIMLTGDNEFVAKKISNKVGIANFKAHLNPFEKAEFIKELKKSGKIVVMAGDGINDALALSNADIAIAMGNGTDVAISVSDVVLLNNSLQSLEKAFKLSQKTYKFIKQNLKISLLYNAITIPLAVLGYVIPLIAAFSMSLSSLIVVGNSLRIKGDKK